MPKTIKLEDHVYNKLTTYLAPKGTYSQVVERVLVVVDEVRKLRDVLEAVTHFRRDQAADIRGHGMQPGPRENNSEEV